MTSPHTLRLVVIAPDLSAFDAADEADLALIERSRQLRIGLLAGGFNLIATLPADTFLRERLAPLQPDMIIVDAESDARDSLEHVVMATRCGSSSHTATATATATTTTTTTTHATTTAHATAR
jgi:response regulator NasT